MPDTTSPLKVFLCHASQDKPSVRELAQRLYSEGWIDPWLDEDKLLPGQDWQMKIEEAVETSDAVVICVSSNSVNKEGFVQKELRYAKEIYFEKPEGSIFLIPLRINECDVPRSVRHLQWADFFGEKKSEAYTNIIKSLKTRYEQILNFEKKGSTEKHKYNVSGNIAESVGNNSPKEERQEEANLPDISRFFGDFAKQSSNFPQEHIVSFVNSQIKAKLYKWQTSNLPGVFPPVKPSIPDDVRELKVLKFARKTATRIALRVQVDERYKIKRDEKPDKESRLKIIEKTMVEDKFVPVEIEKLYSSSSIEMGSYQRPVCAECNGKKTVTIDGSPKNCQNCNGFGYTEKYTEKIRYVYPRETILYSNASPIFPSKRWKDLWHIIQDRSFSGLPFISGDLKEKNNEINSTFKEALRSIEIDIKDMKIRSRFTSELEKYLSVENPEKSGFNRITSDPSTPIIFEALLSDFSQLYGGKGLNVEVENIFANQYKCVAEGAVVYELEYERPFECSVGLLMWKKAKKGIVKGNLFVSDGDKGLEIYKQTEELKSWIE